MTSRSSLLLSYTPLPALHLLSAWPGVTPRPVYSQSSPHAFISSPKSYDICQFHPWLLLRHLAPGGQENAKNRGLLTLICSIKLPVDYVEPPLYPQGVRSIRFLEVISGKEINYHTLKSVLVSSTGSCARDEAARS